MLSRSLLALFALALLFAVAFAASGKVDDVNSNEDIERGVAGQVAKTLLKQVFKFFKKEFSKVDKDCLKELIDGCENPLSHPQRFIRCAEAYLPEHNYCYGDQ